MNVQLPNGDLLSSQASVQLPAISGSPPINATVFPDAVLSRSLISLADYCNNGCTAQLTATGFTICHGDTLVASGSKEPTARLWPINTGGLSESPAANHVITHQYYADYVAFWHATLGSPLQQH